MVHWIQCFVRLWIIVTQTHKAAKICDVHGTWNTNLLYKFRGRAIMLNKQGQVWYFISKKHLDLRRSNPLKRSPGSHSLLVSNSVASQVAACFWRFHSWPALRHHVYVSSASQYPPRTHNCAGLLIVAAQSSRLNCRSRLRYGHMAMYVT